MATDWLTPNAQRLTFLGVVAILDAALQCSRCRSLNGVSMPAMLRLEGLRPRL